MAEIEKPLGAIENGREYLRRLVEHYDFYDEKHPLRNCVEYQEAVRCFEYMADWITTTRSVSDEAVEAALIAWFGDDPWHIGMANEIVEQCRKSMQEAFRAALSSHTGKVTEPNSGVSYTASHLSTLLEQRDAFIVSKGLWAEFTASLQGAET